MKRFPTTMLRCPLPSAYSVLKGQRCSDALCPAPILSSRVNDGQMPFAQRLFCPQGSTMVRCPLPSAYSVLKGQRCSDALCPAPILSSRVNDAQMPFAYPLTGQQGKHVTGARKSSSVCAVLSSVISLLNSRSLATLCRLSSESSIA